MSSDTYEPANVDLWAAVACPTVDARRPTNTSTVARESLLESVVSGRPRGMATGTTEERSCRHRDVSTLPCSFEVAQHGIDVEFNSRVDVNVAFENARWVRGLSPTSADHDSTVTELYGILIKMAYAETRRKGARIQLLGPELDDVAHQAAADATLTVCRKVGTFRGDCRFTTWAYKIVSLDVSSKVNRHSWQRAHVSIDCNDWASLIAATTHTPEQAAEASDLASTVKRIVREDLTERQQRAFGAIAIQGLPVRQVAKEMNSNPNAIYKMMFDARRKLRTGLIAAGYLGAQSSLRHEPT